MKKLTIIVTALAGTMSLTGYSWGLGDALQAVDKVTAVTDNKNSDSGMKAHEEQAAKDRENWQKAQQDGKAQEELRKQRENQDVVIRVSRLIAECDELVKKHEDALKAYDAKAKEIVSGLPEEMKCKSDAMRQSLVCQDVELYRQAKTAGDFSKTNSLYESRRIERDLENRKMGLTRALAQFDEGSSRLDSMKEMGGQVQEQMTHEAEANYRIAVDNSSDVYNKAAREKKKADAAALKGTLSSSEYAAKLREMTAALNEEVRVYRDKMTARRNLIHTLKGKNPSEWSGAILEQPEGDARKSFVKDLLSARGTRGYDKKDIRDAAGALVTQYFTQEELVAAIRDDKDRTDFWEVAASFVTDQGELRSLLLVDDKWIRNCRREGVAVMTRQQVYYTLFKNVTDQDLLVKLLDTEEINFQSCGSDSLGDRDHAVFERLDAAHFAVFDEQREARRNAVKGQTIDFNGLYLGMSRRDAIMMAHGKAKGVGNFGGKYGVFGKGGMSSLWFSAEARHKHLGVKKDGLVGLGELVEKFVQGGLKEVGEVQIGGKADAGYDPENPEISVTTWWYINVPQYKCCIRMYDSGSVKISTTDEDEKVILDFSKTKK